MLQPLSASLQPRHKPNPSRHCLTTLTILISTTLCYHCYTTEHVSLPSFQVHNIFRTCQSCGHSISCPALHFEWTNKNVSSNPSQRVFHSINTADTLNWQVQVPLINWFDLSLDIVLDSTVFQSLLTHIFVQFFSLYLTIFQVLENPVYLRWRSYYYCYCYYH